MLKPYKKEFDIQITQANATVKQTFEVDKSVITISGVMLISNRPDLMVYRGSLRLEINKEEILPDGFSAVRLFSGIVVKPNDRPYDIGKNPAGNGLIKVEYTDTDDGRTVFAPHTVSLCVDGEREDTV
jgi:hypothetical protein